MAKLVRRKGKLLRIGGKLTRSSKDLNPAAPCECCSTPPPPPPPVRWFCNAFTGVCTSDTRDGGYATQAECQANCTAATQTWNCDVSTGLCVAVTGNKGQYLTRADCLANCQGNPFL